MEIKIIQNNDDIVVVPSIYKDLKEPPKFIFRSPNSQDCLNFMFGGNNIFEAVCNCFLRFENKIKLTTTENKEIEYNTYREFVNVGVSGDIALIHNECMNAVANRLMLMMREANETEKKLQSLTNSGKKAQETKTTIQDD